MWEKELWIANRIGIDTDYNGNDISRYSKPQKFYFNYQPVSGRFSILEYGEKKDDIYKAFIDRSYQGKIHTGDVAYLSDENLSENELETIATNDSEICEKANYVVKSVLVQNLKIKVEFIKR